MKFKKLSEMQKLICVSLLFTLSLLAVRVAYTGTMTYLFYPWNLLLALVPFYFSGLLLKQKKFGWKTILVFASWFLFLPNAPYLVTDIFHFEERPPVPAWFDLLLVVSGAWNGVLICMISLFRIEKFLLNRCQIKSPGIIMFLLLISCGYGIYLGRYLRYNSWDVLTEPVSIIQTSGSHVYHPLRNLNVWLFTLAFAVFLSIIYFTIKRLPRVLNAEQR